MLNYIEYLKMPQTWGVIIIGGYAVMNIIGEVLEFKGKVVPEFVRIRKYFKRKRQERETFEEMRSTLTEVQKTLSEVNIHYNADNITKRDNWMHHVDTQQEQDHAWIKRLDEKLDSICADTMDLKIESMREAIISFASYVIEEKNPVTREQFNRIFKRHREYEEIIEAKGLTNGEVDIAIRIINESYEHHMRNHSFVEDVRGYGLE